MDEVRRCYDITLGGYAYNFTFIRIEVHNQHKATGPDEISTKFMKEMAAPVTPALTFIF
jgi:hypothetical protein